MNPRHFNSEEERTKRYVTGAYVTGDEGHDPLTCELCHAEGMGAEIRDMREQRDRWIRLFNRLEGAVAHWVKASAGDGDISEADEALAAAHKLVLKAACGVSDMPLERADSGERA